MDSLTPQNVTSGGIILALIAAIITIIKLHDKRIQRLISDHQEEMKQIRSESAAQTMVVIDVVRQDAVQSEKLAKSIDELKIQGEKNADKLSEAFYAILKQGK